MPFHLFPHGERGAPVARLATLGSGLVVLGSILPGLGIVSVSREASDAGLLLRADASPYASLASNPVFRPQQLETDRGRFVDARSCADLPALTEEAVAAEYRWLHAQGLVGVAVRTGNPGPYSNCYGWVFTGGRYAIDAGVEAILEDNDYQAVTHPRPGDLAVYESAGQFVHVGIVCSVATGADVLIESKWGARGCYRHPATAYPMPAPYRCLFFRSSRQGHRLGDPSGAWSPI